MSGKAYFPQVTKMTDEDRKIFTELGSSLTAQAEAILAALDRATSVAEEILEEIRASTVEIEFLPEGDFDEDDEPQGEH